MKTVVKGLVTNGLKRIAGPGYNLDWPYPSCYNHFFTNLMKQHGNYIRSVGSYTEDANGWPTSVAAGTTFTFFIITMLGLTGSYIRPGIYKARLPAALIAAGWTVQFVDAGGVNITSISAAGSTCTATITDLTSTGNWSGTVLNLLVTAPGSAGPYNMTPGPEVYFQANEAWLDSFNADPVTNYQKMFDPDILTDCTGMKILRTKDWVGTDISALADGSSFGGGHTIRTKTGITRYTNCRQESFRTWQMPTSAQWYTWSDGIQYSLGGMVPYSVQAKLARATGAGLFLSVPLMHDMASYDATAADDTFTCYGHNYNNGDTVVLSAVFPTVSGGALARWTRYYVRDVVPGVSWKLARTLGGVAIDVTADSLRGANYDQLAYKLYTEAETQALYDAIALECFTAAPGIDIVVDVGNENWNVPQPYGWDQCNNCLTVQTGSNFNAGAGYAWAQMRAWRAFEKYYPRSQIIRMISGQHYFFNGIMPQAYGYTDATLFPGKTIANLIDAHCCAIYTYASMTGKNIPTNDGASVVAPFLWGGTWYSTLQYNVGDIVHYTDGNNYRCILQHTNQTPPNATYWVVDSVNGLTGACSTWTDAQMTEYNILSSKSALYYHDLYRSQADAYTVGRNVGFIAYEGGVGYCGQSSAGFAFTGMATFAQKYQTWYLSAAGTDACREFVNLTIKGSGMKTVCYYIGAGQWRYVSDTDATSFGTKRSHHLPDTAFSKYWKTASL